MLRYVGSKKRIVGRLLDAFRGTRLRNNFTFWEPFGGSLSVTFRVLELGPGKVVVGDSNGELINFFEQVRADGATVKRHVKTLARGLDAEKYNAIRSKFNESRGQRTPRQAALFFVLVESAFGQLYRVNSQGNFNASYAATNAESLDPGKIDVLATALSDKRIRLYHMDFRAFFRKFERYMRPGDLLYCDPPYYSTFASYGTAGFAPDEHEALKAACERAAALGVSALVSNSECPEIRQLYAAHSIAPIETTNFRTGSTKEVLITVASQQQQPVAETAGQAVPAKKKVTFSDDAKTQALHEAFDAAASSSAIAAPHPLLREPRGKPKRRSRTSSSSRRSSSSTIAHSLETTA